MITCCIITQNARIHIQIVYSQLVYSVFTCMNAAIECRVGEVEWCEVGIHCVRWDPLCGVGIYRVRWGSTVWGRDLLCEVGIHCVG